MPADRRLCSPDRKPRDPARPSGLPPVRPKSPVRALLTIARRSRSGRSPLGRVRTRATCVGRANCRPSAAGRLEVLEPFGRALLLRVLKQLPLAAFAAHDVERCFADGCDLPDIGVSVLATGPVIMVIIKNRKCEGREDYDGLRRRRSRSVRCRCASSLRLRTRTAACPCSSASSRRRR